MERAIIISKNQKASEYFERYLFGHKIRDITHVTNSARARRMVTEQVYDIAIIVSPLPDETGSALAKEIALIPETQVMFFAKEEFLGEGGEDLMSYGVLTQQIPIAKASTDYAFKLAYAFSKKIKKLSKKTQELQQKLQEIKKVDLAKCLLIENESKSEEEAHKIIERMAMDKRKTKTQVATEIISKYRIS